MLIYYITTDDTTGEVINTAEVEGDFDVTTLISNLGVAGISRRDRGGSGWERYGGDLLIYMTHSEANPPVEEGATYPREELDGHFEPTPAPMDPTAP